MPTVRTKHNIRYADPGGDPAVSQGGIVEVDGVVESTQSAGWRQRLINRGAAASSS